MPVFEFLLWSNCGNSCKFCWQKRQHGKETLLSPDEQKRSILATRDFIKSDEFQRGSHVMLVGGELFEFPYLHNELVSLFRFVSGRMVIRSIDLLYLNTNLLYRDTSTLRDALDMMREDVELSRVRLVTSYDLEGRFASDERKLLFLRNLFMLRSRYPEMPIVVNSILTRPMADAILSGREDFHQFTDRDIAVMTIPYIVLDKSLAMPKFSDITAVLEKMDSLYPGYIRNVARNFLLDQDKLVYEYQAGKGFVFSSSDKLGCGHSENFARCLEDGSCLLCRISDYVRGKGYA